MGLTERYEAIASEVAEACGECGRPDDAVRVIGVSKTVDLDAVEEAISAGLHDFGENRPQELARKHDAFPNERWHFIGNIQSRQLSLVVGRACLIHSLYEGRHADRIERLAAEMDIVQDVLIEVNDGEANKQGLAAEDLLGMLEYCAGLRHVRVRGLMTMAPQGDADLAAQAFERLARLRDSAQREFEHRGVTGMDLRELSMGMSDDYRVAIPRGATMVRIGRAIFSEDFARHPIV